MKVPFIDVAEQHRHLIDELLEEFKTLLNRGDFILGEPVSAFERAFAETIGVKHAIGVNSGTDALVLILRALGIGPGDEVIVPAFTFVATADAVHRVGAKPVFVDVLEGSLNLNPELIPEALTAETRAIIPVHLFGRACEMAPIQEIADSLELAVIEDAAQACGAKTGGRACGALSSAAAFSFYPTKNLGGIGDGGCVTTNNDGMAEVMRMMRDHGKGPDGSFQLIGYNTRLDSIQALYLKYRLEELEDSLLDRIENAKFYHQKLANTNVIRPTITENLSHTYNCYTIQLPGQRDQLAAYLKSQDIGAAVYYPRPVPHEPCFLSLGYQEGDFPVAEEACKNVLSLPIYPGLKRQQMEAACKAVLEFVENRMLAVNS